MGSFPTCLNDPTALLVADASTVINVNATGCAESLIRALPNKVAIVDVVPGELETGRLRGRADADLLKGLVHSKLVEIVRLDDLAEEYFEQLVVGPADATLDDGEAATIAYAASRNGIPVIDERKANRICTKAFPALRIASTVDIFAHPKVERALGRSGLADAVFNALFHGRMRVLPHHVFANTGKEWEQTLRFVDRCDREWKLGVVWVEAVVNESGVACTHRVVDFSTASRKGEPFEAVIQKYGIPNMNYLHCTRELKANAIRSYVQSIGWTNYLIAQGMRADEPKRTKPKDGIIYPLAHIWPTTKPEINDWWREQSFDLELKDYQGNCDGCHKKHLPKLVRIARETPIVFDWWARMEKEYGLAGHNVDGTPRTFYRGHRSAEDIVELSKILTPPPLPDEDEDAGCSESCEAFA